MNTENPSKSMALRVAAAEEISMLDRLKNGSRLAAFRVGLWMLLAPPLAGPVPAPAAERDPFAMHPLPPIAGRWDLQVHDGTQVYPSWLEVHQSGFRTLVGRYVGQFGSARPIGEIHFDTTTGNFDFTVPPQWEHRTSEIQFHGKVEGAELSGETTSDAGKTVHLQGRPAPSLVRAEAPKWGEPIALFNGKDLTGWKPRVPGFRNGWQAEDGVLINANPGNDLLTDRLFTDFKLHAEFRFPKGSNSGIYLRGRYEVQIEDDFGQAPDSHGIGGVYGFLVPRINAAREAGEWQTVNITLVGRIVTVELNGEPVIERQAIPGITGGALDSNEGQPGPLMIQGDHGKVEFRNILLTPAE